MENIFALNNQVFGLNFRERRVSSKTRRAMRSEFLIPTNSVEMTYDDVCDVNGGFDLARGIVAAAIDLAMALICPTLIGIKNVGRFFGKQLAKAFFSGAGKTFVIKALTIGLSAFASYMVNTSIAVLCDNILENLFSCLSIGGIVGLALDYFVDGNLDGYISF